MLYSVTATKSPKIEHQVNNDTAKKKNHPACGTTSASTDTQSKKYYKIKLS